MAQIKGIGLIESEPELKHSEKGRPYVSFFVSEMLGRRKELIRLCAFGDAARQLMQLPFAVGTALWYSGSAELEVYTHRNGYTMDKRLKVTMGQNGFALADDRGDAVDVPILDGDRDPLPE